MDHSQHKPCPHGFCLNHDPEWKNIGEPKLVPAPRLFGLLAIYLTEWHCGRPMIRMFKVQEQTCKKCGRTRLGRIDDPLYFDGMAVCGCCGYHHVVSTPGD